MKRNKLAQLTFLCASLCLLSIGNASASDYGNVRNLIATKQTLASDPKNMAARIDYLDLNVKAGWQEQMIKEHDEKIATEGSTPENLFLRYRLNDKTKKEDYTDLIQKHPNSPWGYYGLALINYDENDYVNAQSNIEKAIALNDSIPLFHIQRIYNFTEDGKPKKGHDFLVKALEKFPQDTNIKEAEAWTYYRLGKLDEAIRAIKEGLEKDPYNKDLHWMLPYTYYDKKRLDKTIEAQQAYLKLWPSNANAWGKLCLFQSQYHDKKYNLSVLDDAIQSCAKAIELAPDQYQAYENMSEIYLRKKWRVHCMWYAQKVLERNPNDHIKGLATNNYDHFMGHMGSSAYSIEVEQPTTYFSSQEELDAHDKQVLSKWQNSRAWTMLGKGSKPSKETLTNIISQHPNFAPAYYLRGVIGFKGYRGNKPVDDFQKAIQLAPKWAKPYSALAAHHIYKRAHQQGRELLKQATTLDANDPMIQFNNGLMVKFDEAIVQPTIDELNGIKEYVASGGDINLSQFDLLGAAFSGFKKRDPTSPKVFEAYGDIFAADPEKKHNSTAIRSYEEAIEVGGDTKRLQQKIEKLK